MKKPIAKIFVMFGACVLAVAFTVMGTFAFASDAFAVHKHTFSTGWTAGEKNHYRVSTCSHDIVSDVQPHSFTGGKCSVCGYAEKVTHTHTYGNEWESDYLNHWHAADCGHDVVRDMAKHTFENGVCSVCGSVAPEENHEHTFSSAWKSDAVNHWHVATCGDNIVSGMAAHTIFGDECSVCGYRIDAVEPEPEPEPKPEEPAFKVTAEGYSEGMYAEWKAEKTDGLKVSYRANGGEEWLEVDKELIRFVSSDTVRADIVGLKAGTYSLKTERGGESVVTDGIKVSAYDRSGYAHFKFSEGVGAYNDDGTPKTDAKIIYVTESNKNTVTATFGKNTYTGIANILSNASKSVTPLNVRIVGRVSAATWAAGLNYEKTDSNTDSDGNLLASAIVGLNGKQLPTGKDLLTQDALIEGGYNKLQTDISVLEGLSSKASYSGGAYDSSWNNCAINGAENVTVEGIGTDAEIFQWGFTWSNCNSIEVRNLTFDDYTEDACSIEGGKEQYSADDFEYKHFWLHHNNFNEGINYWDVSDEQDKHEGDGATDFKRISYVTSSYNHHYNNHKTGLVGANADSMTANVTFHHNYYENCKSRLPLARQANMHMYNNYYKGSTGTNMSLRENAVALIEYCYFDNAKNPVLSDAVSAVALLWECAVHKGSQGSSTELKTVANRVVRLGARDEANGVDNANNQNSFGGLNFYLEPSLFYFTTEAAVTGNRYFIRTGDIPQRLPELAGTLKN